MPTSIMFAALLVSPVSAAVAAPSLAPSPAIMWVKEDGAKEIVRIAFLGFDQEIAPRAPEEVRGKLYYAGRTTTVTLRRKWQGLGAVAGGWVPADYFMNVPHGATGEAVLSLGSNKDGWSFRLGAM